MKRVRLTRKQELRRMSPEAARKWAQRSARKRASRPKASRDFGAGRPRAACPVCGTRMVTDPHHVLYQKHLRSRATFEKWSRGRLTQLLSDVRNRLWVCGQCNHDQEHGPNRPMRRRHVPDAAWAFARELGEWAVVRLERDYPL